MVGVGSGVGVVVGVGVGVGVTTGADLILTQTSLPLFFLHCRVTWEAVTTLTLTLEHLAPALGLAAIDEATGTTSEATSSDATNVFESFPIS